MEFLVVHLESHPETSAHPLMISSLICLYLQKQVVEELSPPVSWFTQVYCLEYGICFLRETKLGTSLVSSGLKRHTSTAGDMGSIPGEELRSHRPQGAAPKKETKLIDRMVFLSSVSQRLLVPRFRNSGNDSPPFNGG